MENKNKYYCSQYSLIVCNYLIKVKIYIYIYYTMQMNIVTIHNLKKT